MVVGAVVVGGVGGLQRGVVSWWRVFRRTPNRQLEANDGEDAAQSCTNHWQRLSYIPVLIKRSEVNDGLILHTLSTITFSRSSHGHVHGSCSFSSFSSF